jgi:RHS repeat-associated protein
MASYVLAGLEIVSQYRAGETSYYLHDGQGSVRALTDPAGAVTDRYTYAAFGELVEQEGATENPYRYTAQQYDEEAGLYSLRARYYDPAAGRFLSRDPLEQWRDVREVNAYAYAVNHPINWSDPIGRQAMGEYGIRIGEEQQEVIWIVAPPFPQWVVAPWWMRIPLWVRLLALITAILEIPWLVPPAGSLQPVPQPQPHPQPQPTAPPTDEATPEPQRCDPAAFLKWWNGLPETGGPATNRWYAYEQRAAREIDAIPGNRPRTVPAGVLTVDADGARAVDCCLIDAKFAANPDHSRYRLDDNPPPYIIPSVTALLGKYRLAITVPNGVPGAQPSRLEIRINSEKQRVFWETMLMATGFVLGVDGSVRVIG